MTESVSECVNQSVTRSPIELFWTAKKRKKANFPYLNIISASLNATLNAVILKINLLQFRTHLYWRKNYSNAILLKRRYNFCDSDCSYAGEKFMLQKTRA